MWLLFRILFNVLQKAVAHYRTYQVSKTRYQMTWVAPDTDVGDIVFVWVFLPNQFGYPQRTQFQIESKEIGDIDGILVRAVISESLQWEIKRESNKGLMLTDRMLKRIINAWQ